MELVLQIVIGLFCLLLTLLGIRAMFMPRSMGEAQSITPNGVVGLNTVRSVIGGFFFGCVAMLALGLATGDATWLLAVAVLMVLVVPADDGRQRCCTHRADVLRWRRREVGLPPRGGGRRPAVEGRQGVLRPGVRHRVAHDRSVFDVSVCNVTIEMFLVASDLRTLSKSRCFGRRTQPSTVTC